MKRKYTKLGKRNDLYLTADSLYQNAYFILLEDAVSLRKNCKMLYVYPSGISVENLRPVFNISEFVHIPFETNDK